MTHPSFSIQLLSNKTERRNIFSSSALKESENTLEGQNGTNQFLLQAKVRNWHFSTHFKNNNFDTNK